jgi:hypothetical protein
MVHKNWAYLWLMWCVTKCIYCLIFKHVKHLPLLNIYHLQCKHSNGLASSFMKYTVHNCYLSIIIIKWHTRTFYNYISEREPIHQSFSILPPHYFPLPLVTTILLSTLMQSTFLYAKCEGEYVALFFLCLAYFT